MQHVQLGRSGLKVSRLVLGCMGFGSPEWRPWVLDEEGSIPIIRRALECGITTFDTADIYSSGHSEEILGRALKAHARRDEVVIATKLYFPTSPGPNSRGLSRKHIMASIDASLRRLGTDHVDLLQIHRFDPEVPLEETLGALDDVVRAGKALYLGASSMFAWQFMRALALQQQHALAPFISMQNQLNLIYREEEREMLPLCRDRGIGVMPWSPLARGLLAGSRAAGTRRAATDAQMADWYTDSSDGPVIDSLVAVANSRGLPQAQVAMAWLLARPGVSAPIIGATRPDQIDSAVEALDVTLDADAISALDAPYRPHAIVGHA